MQNSIIVIGNQALKLNEVFIKYLYLGFGFIQVYSVNLFVRWFRYKMGCANNIRDGDQITRGVVAV